MNIAVNVTVNGFGKGGGAWLNCEDSKNACMIIFTALASLHSHSAWAVSSMTDIHDVTSLWIVPRLSKSKCLSEEWRLWRLIYKSWTHEHACNCKGQGAGPKCWERHQASWWSWWTISPCHRYWLRSSAYQQGLGVGFSTALPIWITMYQCPHALSPCTMSTYISFLYHAYGHFPVPIV